MSSPAEWFEETARLERARARVAGQRLLTNTVRAGKCAFREHPVVSTALTAGLGAGLAALIARKFKAKREQRLEGERGDRSGFLANSVSGLVRAALFQVLSSLVDARKEERDTPSNTPAAENVDAPR